MKIFATFIFLFISFLTFAQNVDDVSINYINGTIQNKNSGKELSNVLVQLRQNDKIIEEVYSDEKGNFQFSLNSNSRYQVITTLENFSKSSKLIYTSKNSSFQNVKFELIPLEEFKVLEDRKLIIMEPIEFDTDDSSISTETAKKLDNVVELLNKYNYLKVNLEFHSNNMGNLQFLQNLSQKRADICANYIIKKGIDSSRINAIGYGFDKPLEICDNENTKNNKVKCTDNYRTEFIVSTIN